MARTAPPNATISSSIKLFSKGMEDEPQNFGQILSGAINKSMEQKLSISRPDARRRSMTMLQAESYMAELDAKGILQDGWCPSYPVEDCTGGSAAAAPRARQGKADSGQEGNRQLHSGDSQEGINPVGSGGHNNGGEGAPADGPGLGSVTRLLQTLKSFGGKGDTEDTAPVAPARRRGSMDLPGVDGGTREGRAYVAAGSRRGSMELPGADSGVAERKAGAMGYRRDAMDTAEEGKKAAAASPQCRGASLQITAGGSRAPAAQARLAAAAFDAPDRSRLPLSALGRPADDSDSLSHLVSASGPRRSSLSLEAKLYTRTPHPADLALASSMYEPCLTPSRSGGLPHKSVLGEAPSGGLPHKSLLGEGPSHGPLQPTRSFTSRRGSVAEPPDAYGRGAAEPVAPKQAGSRVSIDIGAMSRAENANAAGGGKPGALPQMRSRASGLGGD